MKRLFIAAALGAAFATAPAHAQSAIGTMERGTYICELPGNAAGRAGREQPEQNFSINGSSRYVSPKGSGTYLRRGNRLIFSSGARQGEIYRVISRRFLRRIEDGELGRLRCVRRGR